MLLDAVQTAYREQVMMDDKLRNYHDSLVVGAGTRTDRLIKMFHKM